MMQKKVPQLMKKMIKKNNGTFKSALLKGLGTEKRNGITQAGLAERMNVSRTCIANWESGERIPEVAAITYLAKLLKSPLTTFAAERTNGTE